MCVYFYRSMCGSMSSFLRDAEAPDVTEPSLSGGAERRAQH